jgi:class 3 adenylate cyclase
MGLKKLQAEIKAKAGQEQQGALCLLTAGIAAERGAFQEADKLFVQCRKMSRLAPWAIFGQAFSAMRQRDLGEACKLLDEAEASLKSRADKSLRAAIEHLRGAITYHQGDSDSSLQHLRCALELFGNDHFGTGRVLDTLGMLYATKENLPAASALFTRAIETKKQFDDQPGLAVSYGNLGRLYLDWGYLDKAEAFFQENLRISQSNLDGHGEALMCNHLAQVALARCHQCKSAGQALTAQKYRRAAGDWLDQCIADASQNDWPLREAYARKDRALIYLAADDEKNAEQEIRPAEALFRKLSFDEGLAHAHRVWGIIHRMQGQYAKSSRILSLALAHFQQGDEKAEIARTLLEIAHTRHAAGGARPQVTQEYLRALQAAEQSRRPQLVKQAEEALRLIDIEAFWAHLYRRVRGQLAEEASDSLVTGSRETSSILCLDLQGSTDYALGRDPEEVMLTINQMMADFTSVLRAHQTQICTFRGDGFLALVRGPNHAVRAVKAGLDLLDRLEEFNEPRALLELPPFKARVGIASGEVLLGNVGTYDKVDFTAMGTTPNLSARLEGIAQPGMPCISRQTQEMVRDRFCYHRSSPRTVFLKGLGDQQVWDVVGSGKS